MTTKSDGFVSRRASVQDELQIDAPLREVRKRRLRLIVIVHLLIVATFFISTFFLSNFV